MKFQSYKIYLPITLTHSYKYSNDTLLVRKDVAKRHEKGSHVGLGHLVLTNLIIGKPFLGYECQMVPHHLISFKDVSFIASHYYLIIILYHFLLNQFNYKK